ncbi:hypothetical protein [Romboutsia sp. MSSM.1001216sp_RTP31141st1_G3_RTP31141_220114]|uniref:hypothetical protein n=1 Tax=unclassified Romboutsia TaxID=2626894 RepID=UPI0031B58616
MRNIGERNTNQLKDKILCEIDKTEYIEMMPDVYIILSILINLKDCEIDISNIRGYIKEKFKLEKTDEEIMDVYRLIKFYE